VSAFHGAPPNAPPNASGSATGAACVHVVEPPSALAAFSAVREALQRATIGHGLLVDRLLITLLSRGHVLLEGPPGTAKTRTVKRFAALLGADFVRVQATPDLLPADLTGTDVHRGNGEFRFAPGPLFHHVVLVDEINRAPPKVQSALLEAMGEGQISTGGVTRPLAAPFLVAATQNPIEHEGTYPLPEAQLDRFLFRVELRLPGVADERRILDLVLDEGRDGIGVQPAALALDTIRQAWRDVDAIHLSDAVRDYIVRLSCATRGEGQGGTAAVDIVQPASPRASLALASGARASAWLAGRDHVLPDDIATLAGDTLAHRIALDYRARAEGRTARGAIDAILDATPRV